jgi:hypothetical protein
MGRSDVRFWHTAAVDEAFDVRLATLSRQPALWPRGQLVTRTGRSARLTGHLIKAARVPDA